MRQKGKAENAEMLSVQKERGGEREREVTQRPCHIAMESASEARCPERAVLCITVSTLSL